MDKRTKYRLNRERDRLKSELIKLLKEETGVQTNETLAYYLQVILRKNAIGELLVPVHIVDWLIMTAYMPNPDIYILQLLISVLQEPHDFKVKKTE